VRYSGPARRFVSPSGPSLATLDVTLVHNAYDTDVDAVITPGSGAATTTSRSGSDPRDTTPAPTFHLPLSSGAVSSDWLPGNAAAGNIEWRFRIEVSDPAVSSWLPPDGTNLWMLSVAEGGDPARHGRVTSYRLTWHSSMGDVIYDGGPIPQETVEGGTVYASASQAALDVGPPNAGRALRFGPNPVPAGGTVSFSTATPQAGPLAVFDLSGRRVGSAAFAAGAGAFEARWSARSGAGEPLAPGIYFARLARGPTLRIAVVGR